MSLGCWLCSWFPLVCRGKLITAVKGGVKKMIKIERIVEKKILVADFGKVKLFRIIEDENDILENFSQ
jgi:hypothetical protein